MPTGPDELPPNLLHLHVCKHCGGAIRGDDFKRRALISGIYLCPKCGLEGLVNTEIPQMNERPLKFSEGAGTAESHTSLPEKTSAPEFLGINLQRALVTLADELSYPKAAAKLTITFAELKRQIVSLETQLCVHIFRPGQKRVELTEEGKCLIRVFRQSVALHDREISDGPAKAGE